MSTTPTTIYLSGVLPAYDANALRQIGEAAALWHDNASRMLDLEERKPTFTESEVIHALRALEEAAKVLVPVIIAARQHGDIHPGA